MRKVSKGTWIIILVCSIIVLLLALFLLYKYFIKEDSLPQTAQSTTESTTIENTTEESTTPPRFDYVLAEEPDINAIDFNELKEINEEIYSWIYVPNTNVDYPVVNPYVSGADYYYLDHNIYGEYQFSGTIYSETCNTRTYNDPVTVLYGHNMINGSMFQSLHKFEDEDFFNENNTMFVFTEDKLITYLIYSAFDYDDRHILNSFHMDAEEDFLTFVNDTLEPYSIVYNVRPNVTIEKDDKLLVLSTCSNHSSTSRFLVVGVKVSERARK